MAYYPSHPCSVVHKLKTCIIGAALSLMFHPGLLMADTETGWVKVREKEDIRIYSRHVAGSDIIKVKTDVIINAGMREIQDILDQVAARKNWVPYLAESRRLHSFSATEHVEYSLFSAPWPASDRDFVYRMTLLHADEHSIMYRMVSEVHPLMPEHRGRVRAELIESMYTLSALGPHQTRVELVFHADPGGWLPTWIINIIQKALPFLMLKNLRELAESSD